RSRTGVHERAGQRARQRLPVRELRVPGDRRRLPGRGRSGGRAAAARGLERVGLVEAPNRGWGVYAGPAGCLPAATVAVIVVRAEWRHATASGPGAPAHVTRKPAAPRGRAFYIVRAGDTLDAIAVKVKVSVARLLKLNPRLSPTALFIGERIRLR